MRADVSFNARDIGRILATHLFQEGYNVDEADFTIPEDLQIKVSGLTPLGPTSPVRQVSIVEYTPSTPAAPAAPTTAPPAPRPGMNGIETDGISNPNVILEGETEVRILDVPRGPSGLARWSSKVGVRGDPTVAPPPVYPETPRVRRTIELDKAGQPRLLAANDPHAEAAADVVPVIRSPKGPVDPVVQQGLREAEKPLVDTGTETVFQQLLRMRRSRG